MTCEIAGRATRSASLPQRLIRGSPSQSMPRSLGAVSGLRSFKRGGHVYILPDDAPATVSYSIVAGHAPQVYRSGSMRPTFLHVAGCLRIRPRRNALLHPSFTKQHKCSDAKAVLLKLKDIKLQSHAGNCPCLISRYDMIRS